MNPYGPEIQTEFCYFLGGNDLKSGKGGIYESPPDRYVPNSLSADLRLSSFSGNQSAVYESLSGLQVQNPEKSSQSLPDPESLITNLFRWELI